MSKDKWIWMPRAGHFICGDKCQFHLNTYVNGYIVSTVGELWPEMEARKILAQVYDPKWLSENSHLKGDYFDRAYKEKFGYEKVGCDRTYETVVFRAKKSEHKCCPYVRKSGEDVDFSAYNKPEDAYKGHLAMCLKYDKLGVKDETQR